MGTNGLYGIRKNGIDKCTYNHFDSYPDCLGKKIVEFCNNNIENLEKFFDNIELVSENECPTDKQIEFCKASGYADLSVSTQNVDDWYCLLRNMQGNFEAYQMCIDNDNKIYMTDDIDFIKNSLFCEYAYIINLDDNVLEYYMGFQHSPQENNRYGTEKYDFVNRPEFEYYPCKLSLTFPLNELYDVEQIVEAMNERSLDD